MTPNQLPIAVRHIVITRTYSAAESGPVDPRPFEYVTECGRFRWAHELPRPTSDTPARTCELCTLRGDKHSSYTTIGHTAAEIANLPTIITNQTK